MVVNEENKKDTQTEASSAAGDGGRLQQAELKDSEAAEGVETEVVVAEGAVDGTTAASDSAVETAVSPKVASMPVWFDLLAIIGVIFASSIFAGIVGSVMKFMRPEVTTEFQTFVVYTLSFSLAICFTMWLLRKRGVRKTYSYFSLRKTNPPLILWGLLLVMVTSVVIDPLLGLLPAEYLEKLNQSIGSGGWAIMTTIVMAPILEEILFRGMIQEYVSRKYGALVGVILSAAIFGAIHMIPQQIINAFFIGIILGYIFLKTKSLIPVIIIHSINNALSYIFTVVYEGETGDTFRDMIGNDSWYWVVYASCAVVFVIAAVNVVMQLRKVTKLQMEAKI